MRLLTKKDEIKDFLRRRNYDTEKWLDYYAKKNYILDLGDYYIMQELDFAIDSTMYYDDEYAAPSTSKENWKHYNYRLHYRECGVEEWTKKMKEFNKTGSTYGILLKPVIFCNNTRDKQQVIPVFTENRWYGGAENLAVRELTKEEIKAIYEMQKLIREKYEKRLEVYYKKYSEKISTYGYWANR